jgi:hypothetical protein
VIRFLIFLAFFSGSGKQVAYVDLTVPSRTPHLGSVTVGDGGLVDRMSVSGGGGFGYHGGLDPRTLPVSVKLGRLVSVVQNGTARDSIEIVLTNTSEREIVLPIGDDPNLALAPYATDRSELSFVVVATNIDSQTAPVARMVGSGHAAASDTHSATVAHVAPGDSVTYKLPINRWRADQARKLVQGAELRLGAEVEFGRVETRPDGTEAHIGVGDTIRSENRLAWPPN